MSETDFPFASEPAEKAYQALIGTGVNASRDQFRQSLQAFIFEKERSRNSYEKWRDERAALENAEILKRLPLVRWISVGAYLYFGRQADGSVIVAVMQDARRPDDPNGCLFLYQYLICRDHWVSDVLTMTAFSERPNDWHAFGAHHDGKMDLLKAMKTLQTIKNVLAAD